MIDMTSGKTATARPRPQVMRLTEAAAERIKDILARADRPIAGVRVGVKNGGCAGMSYTMEYAEKVNPLDELVEDKGVRILIDPKAVLFLLGSQMDFKIDRLSASFAFSNPNETSACGCGESVAITPASPEALKAHASNWGVYEESARANGKIPDRRKWRIVTFAHVAATR